MVSPLTRAAHDYAASILAKIPGTSSKLDRELKKLVESLEAYMPADQVS